MTLRLTPPIRFVATILFLWVGSRILFWAPLGIAANDALFRPDPGSLRPEIVAGPVTASMSAAAETAPLAIGPVATANGPRPFARSWTSSHRASTSPAAALAPQIHRQIGIPQNSRLAFTDFGPSPANLPSGGARSSPPLLQAGQQTTITTERRWRLSSWALWRSGGGLTPLASVGQLGGSQAGMRVQYRLTRIAGVDLALSGRVSRPIELDNGSEAAVGVSMRPVRSVPVELTFERRVALDRGGRDGWSLGLAGGVDHIRLPLHFELDAYGQAGVVGANRRDLYGEAALTIERPIALSERTSIAIGGGSWAAAQPGVARVDIGPQASLRIPMGDGALRLTAGWRQRIAGNASPGSGPALTLGTDF